MPCDTEVIHIQPGGSVNKQTVTLRKRDQQRVIWVSEADEDFEIQFKNAESPFPKHTYEVKAHGWEESGPITGPPKGQPYEYDMVRKGTKTVAADPGIKIDP
jgi:hypothetical protein